MIRPQQLWLQDYTACSTSSASKNQNVAISCLAAYRLLIDLEESCQQHKRLIKEVVDANYLLYDLLIEDYQDYGGAAWPSAVGISNQFQVLETYIGMLAYQLQLFPFEDQRCHQVWQESLRNLLVVQDFLRLISSNSQE